MPDRGTGWATNRSRHAVLSSGGKESLLSFGLLDELGYETHPIFVNESGRHWFTALNAYRHFEREIPNTSRVWTSSDRVFNWMLRHLPFIRPDFASMRSDDYPMRLWTVAVFLFGILPLVRLRGIGRIVIGDEFDTTRRAFHKGVPHYDGLYRPEPLLRQPPDPAISSARAGRSSSSRCSVRSPSCWSRRSWSNATGTCSASRSRATRPTPRMTGSHPCGRCEKCRRVVGMLKALGADPGRCGYTERAGRRLPRGPGFTSTSTRSRRAPSR